MKRSDNMQSRYQGIGIWRFDIACIGEVEKAYFRSSWFASILDVADSMELEKEKKSFPAALYSTRWGLNMIIESYTS